MLATWRWALVPAAILILGLSLIFAQKGLVDGSEWDHLYYYEDVRPDRSIDGKPIGVTFDAVNNLRQLNVLSGTDCAPKKFCPQSPATRKDLAVWLVRLVDENPPDLLDPGESFDSRFSDVPPNLPAGPLIDRLAELGITAGCKTTPARYCPDGGVNRHQLATFISRALDLPSPKQSFGFWDVDPAQANHIDRLVAAGFDDGCGGARLVPRRFCPDLPLSRGQLAQKLSQVADYLKANIDPQGELISPAALNLTTSWRNEGLKDFVKVSWTNPQSGPHPTKYILQWRPTYIDFTHQRYQTIDYSARGDYSFEIIQHFSEDAYAVRLITINQSGSQRATPELKVLSPDNQLRDLVKEQIIDVYGPTQPWLVDTWIHLDGPNATLRVNSRVRDVVGTRSVYGLVNRLEQKIADEMLLSQNVFDNFERKALPSNGRVAHELGHVYTLTSGITQDEAPIAAGHLYLWRLREKYGPTAKDLSRCHPVELFADLATLAYSGEYEYFNPNGGVLAPYDAPILGYWQLCGFKIEGEAWAQTKAEVVDLAHKVFIDQTLPSWFIDRYQAGGKTDLDKLWRDISEIPHGTRGKDQIIYGFANSFGGYCDEKQVRLFQEGKVDSLPTPWREAGGCPDEPKTVEEDEPPEEQDPKTLPNPDDASDDDLPPVPDKPDNPQPNPDPNPNPQPNLADIIFRDTLIAAQEKLLNTYRCRFLVDVHIVPGGCVNSQPRITSPATPEFAGVPSWEAVAERDSLIAAQEKLLNVYRCRFSVDTHIVPGGCG